ncbi:MAG: RNA polymerase sigma-70 factor (ECF subfamily) [Verrucomicrobiales bacterium]|jgi:RNA polymerase sigma-70 factor (ECF subfamily)
MTRAELADLYDRYADTLFCFLISFTGSEDESREVLQELFALLAKGKRKVDQAANLKSYLIKMARNLAIDLTRRRQTRDRTAQQLLAAPQTPIFAEADDPDAQLFREEVSRALASLPEEQREVVHLKLWAGLTFDQIAEACGVSLNTAASRFRYGIDKMRTQLRPVYDEVIQDVA